MVTSKPGRKLAAGVLALLAALFEARTPHAQTSETKAPEAPAADAAPTETPPATPVEAEAQATPAATAADPAEPPEVTVAGSRVSKTPGSAYVINNKKLERVEYDDPQAILQTVPGVYVRTEDGVGLRPNIGLRGANPNRSAKVALMEDGIPFGPAPYSAPAAYYFPLMTRMYQVRVLKGPATIVYGPQTVGGAIDLITRPIPASPTASVDLAIGQYGYAKFHGWYGASNESDGFLLEAVHLRDSGFKELPDDSDTGFHRNEWMVKAAHLFDPSSEHKNELSIKATYSEEDSHETYLGITDQDFRENPNQRYAASQMDRMRWNRTAVAISHVLEPARGVRITSTAYRNDFHRIWNRFKALGGAGEGALFDVLQHPDASPENQHIYGVLTGREDSIGGSSGDVILWGPNDREFVSQGIQTIVSLEPVTGPLTHRIEYGIRLHYDRVERRQSQDGYLMLGGELVPEGTPTVVTEFNEASTESAALYVIDAVTWKSLTLTPGVRVEFWHATGVNKLNDTEDGGSQRAVLPGIGAYYSIIDGLGMLAGVYRGFSPPPPPLPSEDTGAAQEQPGLQDPELSINYEFGARYASAPARLELIGFYNDYSNLTDICTQSSGCLDQSLDRQFDAGRAKIYGLEAFAEHEPSLGTWRFPISIAYTLTFAEFLDRFDSNDPMWGSVIPGDELPYVPRHQLNAQVGVEEDHGGVYAAFSYVAAMREEAGSEPIDEALATDEQTVVDVGAHYRVLEPLDLYLNVRNLFDSQALVARRPFGARPNAPRWVQVGAKVKF
jgi:Fe(3+) dicitrate transport protein